MATPETISHISWTGISSTEPEGVDEAVAAAGDADMRDDLRGAAEICRNSPTGDSGVVGKVNNTHDTDGGRLILVTIFLYTQATGWRVIVIVVVACRFLYFLELLFFLFLSSMSLAIGL